MAAEENYQLHEQCQGCGNNVGLRQVTVNDVHFTLCHACEQRIITAMLRGEL